jgi:hypothetical protein
LTLWGFKTVALPSSSSAKELERPLFEHIDQFAFSDHNECRPSISPFKLRRFYGLKKKVFNIGSEQCAILVTLSFIDQYKM